MALIPILLAIAFMGFLVWIILQIPMPQLFKNILLGVMGFLLVVFLLQALGVETGMPAIHLR